MYLHARPQPPNCKGRALSLINRQSDSHRKTTNTCIANAVDWIQNPIDTFRIHMEIWVFEYSFKNQKNRPQRGFYLYRNCRVQQPYYLFVSGWLMMSNNPKSGNHICYYWDQSYQRWFVIELTLTHWAILFTSFCII